MSDFSHLTIALADTRWVGHHPTYFREFVASLRRLGARVIALCPSPEEVDAGDGVLRERNPAPPCSVLFASRDVDPLATLCRWWATGRALDAIEHRSGWRADFVFFPYLDNYLRFLPRAIAPTALLGRRWSGLYFRNQHFGWAANGPATAFKRLMKGDRALRSELAHPAIGVLDERFDEAMSAITGRRVIHFPDITDETTPDGPTEFSARLLELARGRPIIGLIGLEKRKGLMTLLRVAQQAQGREDWFFAAVGPFPPEVYRPDELEWIERVAGELKDSVFIDLAGQQIPDGKPFNAVFQTFDVAWAAYEDFQGSSNTLTKAALLEKHVLATAGECVGHRVLDFQLGIAIAQGDVTAAVNALRCLVRREGRDGRMLEARFADYRRLHSRKQLDASFRTLLSHIPSSHSRS